MTTYNNKGNLFYVYFIWQDKELWRFQSWADAKKWNRGRPIYLAARLHSETYGSDELIEWVRFDKKPKIGQIKRFMKQILADKKLQEYKVPYGEWNKFAMKDRIKIKIW